MEPRYFEAFVLFQVFYSIQHGVMFGLDRDHMTAAIYATSRQAEDGEIARLCPAAGENNFVRYYPQQRGQLITRIIDGCACLASRCMYARRIPKVPVEIR